MHSIELFEFRGFLKWSSKIFKNKYDYLLEYNNNGVEMMIKIIVIFIEMNTEYIPIESNGCWCRTKKYDNQLNMALIKKIH